MTPRELINLLLNCKMDSRIIFSSESLGGKLFDDKVSAGRTLGITYLNLYNSNPEIPNLSKSTILDKTKND